MTPLHESLVYGSKEQVRTLLQWAASVGKLSGEDKMFKIFRLLQNVVDSVASLSELKIEDGKTSMDLAENSDTEEMLEVLSDQRKENIMQNKESQVQTETAGEVVKETEVVQLKSKMLN